MSLELEKVVIVPNGIVSVTGRAQNGFGGLNVEHAVLLADDTLEPSGAPGIRKAWLAGGYDKSREDLTWEVGSAAGFDGLLNR